LPRGAEESEQQNEQKVLRTKVRRMPKKTAGGVHLLILIDLVDSISNGFRPASIFWRNED